MPTFHGESIRFLLAYHLAPRVLPRFGRYRSVRWLLRHFVSGKHFREGAEGSYEHPAFDEYVTWGMAYQSVFRMRPVPWVVQQAESALSGPRGRR